MTKAKYHVGDRLEGSPFVIRGVMRKSNGDYRYFVQIGNGDNTFVADTAELENAIELVRNAVIEF